MNEQDITGTTDFSAVYTFDDSGIRRTDPNFLKLRVTPSLPSNQFDEPFISKCDNLKKISCSFI